MPATNLDDAQKKELGITGDANGVYVMDVDPQGAAGQAGIQKGDAIISINGIATPAAPQMVEQIARHKPGDKLNITVQRGNEQKTFDVTLKGKAGSFATLAPAAMSSLGLAVKDLSKEDADKLGITGGVQVTDIKDGVIGNETNMKPGFIITNVAGRTVKNVAELKAVLANVKGNFQIQGVYPDSNEVYYYGVNGLNK
jgi:S1-C subfamily serine protease